MMASITDQQINITKSGILLALKKGVELIGEKMDVSLYRTKYKAFEDYKISLHITNLQILGITTNMSMDIGFLVEGNEPKIVSNIKNPDITGTCSYATLRAICAGHILIKRGPMKGEYLRFSPRKAVQKEMLVFKGPKTVWMTKIDFLDDIFNDMEQMNIIGAISKMLP